MEPNDYEDEPKKNKSKWLLFILIGIAVGVFVTTVLYPGFMEEKDNTKDVTEEQNDKKTIKIGRAHV